MRGPMIATAAATTAAPARPRLVPNAVAADAEITSAPTMIAAVLAAKNEPMIARPSLRWTMKPCIAAEASTMPRPTP